MSFSHPYLSSFEFQYPGPLAAEILRGHRFKRSCALSNLIQPKDGTCKWCNVHKVPGKRHYCSDECSDSAYMFCYPQKPGAKMWIFIKLQSCTCTFCGEIFEDQIREMIEKDYARTKKWLDEKGLPPESVGFSLLGLGTGDRWHVDHIIPISRGGDGIGFENVQVICKVCHLKKTAREAMGLPVAQRKK